MFGAGYLLGLGGLEKTAAWGQLFRGAANSAGKFVSNTVKGLPETLSNFAKGPMKDYANRAGNFLGTAISGKQARVGFKQMRSAARAGVPNQARFNAGLKNLAAGAAKTGLVYGGGLYAGKKLYDTTLGG